MYPIGAHVYIDGCRRATVTDVYRDAYEVRLDGDPLRQPSMITPMLRVGLAKWSLQCPMCSEDALTPREPHTGKQRCLNLECGAEVTS